MQRFLRKPPQRVTLATLLGVYRAVMRLSSIVGALDDAFEDDAAGDKAESGPTLFREHIVSPLQKVSYLAVFVLVLFLVWTYSPASSQNCCEITDVGKRRVNLRLGEEPEEQTLRSCCSPCHLVRAQGYFLCARSGIRLFGRLFLICPSSRAYVKKWSIWITCGKAAGSKFVSGHHFTPNCSGWGRSSPALRKRWPACSRTLRHRPRFVPRLRRLPHVPLAG